MGAAWRRRLQERAELSRWRWLWRLITALGASLATTLIASVATGAFAAYHFNRLSFLGVVANLLEHRTIQRNRGGAFLPVGFVSHPPRRWTMSVA